MRCIVLRLLIVGWVVLVTSSASATLLLDLPCDEGSGTSCPDQSGGNHHMSLNGGVTWRQPGFIGPAAIRVDGATQYGRIPGATSLQTPSTFTVSMWLSVGPVPTHRCELFSYDDRLIVSLYPDRDVAGAFHSGGGTYQQVLAPASSLPLRTRQHLVFTRDAGGLLAIYVENGLRQTAASTGSVVYGTGGDIYMGRHGNGSEQLTCNDLVIDQIELYNTSADRAAVDRLYRQGPPTIQGLVNGANPGDTIVVPPGLYREQVTVPIANATLEGYGMAEVRGSDVWDTGWTAVGPRWSHGGAPTLPHPNGQCRPGTSRCNWPEQVFYDGMALLQVASNPNSGQFSVESGNIIIADNPAGHLVEVTMRPHWMVIQAHGVTVQGFTMRHAGSPAQFGGLMSDGFNDVTVQHNMLTDAHGANATLKGGTRLKLIGNTMLRGGNMGGGSSEATDVEIRGNTFAHNNTEDYEPGWHAGGTKSAILTRVLYDANVVYKNGGPGLWCDIDCQQVVIRHNTIDENEEDGIFFEISDFAQVYGNLIRKNGFGRAKWCYGAGILVSSSSHVEVFSNVVAYNARGITALSQNRPPHNTGMTNVHIHDNIIHQEEQPAVDGTGGIALGFCQDWTDPIFAPAANNRGGANRIWYPVAENGNGRLSWNNTLLTTLAACNATPCGNGTTTYLTNAEKDAVDLPWVSTIRYIDNTQPCPGVGTSAEPYCTLARAFEHVQAGDRLRIRSGMGIYQEYARANGKDGTATRPIIVEPDTNAVFILRNCQQGTAQAAIEVTNSDHWHFENLRFDGTGCASGTSRYALRVQGGTEAITGVQAVIASVQGWREGSVIQVMP